MGAVQGSVRAGGGNTGKAPSSSADEAGSQGCHWARSVQRRKKGCRQENTGGKISGVLGNDRVREASRVAHKSPRVEEEDVVREASRVAENSGGGGATEWEGKSSRHRAPTPPEWTR